ncbi:STAS domain-containing protein [Sphaerisporangium corydalis]|uniref:Anti-sigma factor antagonist n=1 Tax=Sphaerisporangium corydalis TaxID=1441875 RepID=A0ABV9EMR7_9ACTN|nr:STAS domain-containing protein [Sphaerisporangium corydalis]
MDAENEPVFALPASGAVVIRATGDLDFGSAPTFRDQIDTARRTPQATVVIIDLSEVELFDSSGLGELVHARKECDASGIRLLLAAPQDNVRRRLAITGLSSLFDLFPSVADALHDTR